MDYHLHTTLPAGNAHRLSVPGDLEAAKAYALEHFPLGAAMIFEGGGAELFGGRLVAVYADGAGWVDPIGNPLDWWLRLPVEAREILAADPFSPIRGDALEALVEAGASTVFAYWVDADDDRDDGFKLLHEDAVFVAAASRLDLPPAADSYRQI